MAMLVIDKFIKNGVHKVTFSLSNVSSSELLLADAFGEPSYTFGGTFDPKSGAFLTRYFPDAPELIPDWVPFQEYATGDEVRFTDGSYYRALAPVLFENDPNITEWVEFQNYQIGSVVKYADGKYYKAVQEVNFDIGSPNPAGITITEWIEPGNVGAGDYVSGDIVKVTTTGTYYKAIADSPADWDPNIEYSIGDIVFFDSTGTPPGDDYFYEAVVNSPRKGTQVKLTVSIVSGTTDPLFSPGETITQANTGATATVVSWDGVSVLIVDNVSGTFNTTDSITQQNSDVVATITEIQYSDPASNTDEWQITSKANPGYTNSEYWVRYTDQNPDGQDQRWVLYTDKDPNVNTTLWESFVPEGQSPQSTVPFTVPKITRFLISGLPITFDFSGPYAEQNANDFAVVVEKDIDEVWDNFTAQQDDFTGQKIVDLND